MMPSSDWNLSIRGTLLESGREAIRSMMLKPWNVSQENRTPARRDYQIPTMLGISRKLRSRSVPPKVSAGGFDFTTRSFSTLGEVIIVKVLCGPGDKPDLISIRIVLENGRGNTAPRCIRRDYVCSHDAALCN